MSIARTLAQRMRKSVRDAKYRARNYHDIRARRIARRAKEKATCPSV